MGKKKKQESNEVSERTSHSDFGHEIWGLVFLALGVLVIISLVSYLSTASSNVLGPWLGNSLASGLVFLFGKIPAFVLPLGICYFGWLRLRGEQLRVRILLFWTVLTIEVCVLLAIHHQPLLVQNPSLILKSNNIGIFFVKALKIIFGPHRFGPYFLTGLAFAVTVLAGFRIPPQAVGKWLWKMMRWSAQRAILTFESMKRKMRESREADAAARAARAQQKQALAAQKQELAASKQLAVQGGPVAGGATENPKKTASSKLPAKSDVEKTANAAVPETASSETGAVAVEIEADAEEEARRRLEEELAAFRAKKRDPIQIMTIETADIEPDEFEIDSKQVGVAAGEDDEEDGGVKGLRASKPSGPVKPYELPLPDVIPDPPALSSMVDKEGIERNSMTLEKTLMNFGVEGKVVFVSPGPVVTRYEIELAPGIKVSKVVGLHDDISMAVGGQRIRIEAPIPGKSAVGIELPNAERQIVYFKHILTAETFRKSKAKLPVIIGTNISGAPYVTDITKMPHVLIAGQTGSGKSVCINSVICSLLMTKKPDELRLIMIDPKKVELAFYEGIPHLLSPVVTESKEAVKALQWGVIEMERRYRVLARVGARNIDSFNTRIESGKLKGILPDEDNKPLPFIVIIVDELADLMMTASKDVEGLIQRIAQLARAVGLHLIVATQRPSVDIITGPIKANLTSRIGFRTIQSTDSRTILGHVGAEKLLGMGDMLFLRNGAPEIERFHGAFISEEDVEKIVAEVRKQEVEIEKIESFLDATEGNDEDFAPDDGERDELLEEAARIIVSIGQGSTSLLQRRMKIGYARAGRLMDVLEKAGFVGPPDGSKAREVLVRPDELDDLLARIR